MLFFFKSLKVKFCLEKFLRVMVVNRSNICYNYLGFAGFYFGFYYRRLISGKVIRFYWDLVFRFVNGFFRGCC